MLGVPKGCETEQRADRREPSVAGPHAVSPLVFEMLEKASDERGVEMIGFELRGRDAPLLGREPNQHPHSVAVGSDRVRAGLALLHKAIGKERLKCWGEQTHDAPAR